MAEDSKEKILVMRNTSRATFETCPRKYYYTWREMLVPRTGSSALRGGSTWHEMLKSYYKSAQEHGWEYAQTNIQDHIHAGHECYKNESEDFNFFDDYRNLPNLTELFLEYIELYKEENNYVEILDVEVQDNFQLIPEEKELEKMPFLDGWKIFMNYQVDLRYKQGTSIWIMEHKTTGANINQALNSLHRTNQVQTYLYGDMTKNPDQAHQIQGAMVNLAQYSSRKSPKTGEYGKLTTNFRRAPEIYTPVDLMEWRLGVLATAEKIIRAKEQEFYPVNLDNCYQYNTTCSYAKLCEQPHKPLDFMLGLNTDEFKAQSPSQSYMIGSHA